jgi:hypothetical protein
MSGEIETQGTVLKRGSGTGSPETFTAIKNITSINPMGKSRALIDVTNLDSTSREYKLAIKDGQEIQVEINYDPSDTQHNGLSTDCDDGTARHFQMLLADSPATTFTFTALVMNWSMNTAIDSVGKLTVTLKPTGDIVKS